MVGGVRQTPFPHHPPTMGRRYRRPHGRHGPVGGGAGGAAGNAHRDGWRWRAYRDVFTAIPSSPSRLAHANARVHAIAFALSLPRFAPQTAGPVSPSPKPCRFAAAPDSGAPFTRRLSLSDISTPNAVSMATADLSEVGREGLLGTLIAMDGDGEPTGTYSRRFPAAPPAPPKPTQQRGCSCRCSRFCRPQARTPSYRSFSHRHATLRHPR